MRILLTNHTLDIRAGSELYVRDLALGLLARGHQPIAYSRQLGEVAQEMRDATIPVLDDLDTLERPPDLIHAQHHLEAMTALTRFPGVPAVYVCHGWLPHPEAPPLHPRILRYVAVDALVRQRLVDECGIPEERVETHLNFVDLDRFQPRLSPLPSTPARALVFSNYVSEDNVLPALREACRNAGIELDVLGRKMGRRTATPEAELVHYALVFATARAALEAMAVGAAVIVCDRAGLGPLVTSDELDSLRDFNFGVRLLRRPVTPEGVTREIERYDARDAAAVSRRIRQEASLEAALDRSIRLYRQILDEFPATRPSLEEEGRATSRYLRHGPLTGDDLFRRERLQLRAEAASERDRVRRLQQALQKAQAESSKARKEAAQQRQLSRQVNDLRAELTWMRNSATWRWRERLLRPRWLQAVYRKLFVRG